MTTFIQINQQGVGAQLELAQSSLVETPNTPELITTTGAGTWTKPAGVTQVLVECWGGGGGGGGCSSNNSFGGGGAGGQYAKKFITYPSAQQSISYTVGAGGLGNLGAVGSTGNDTTWDTNVVVAKGGDGGSANNTSQIPIAIGAFGSTDGGIGDVVYAGGNGRGGYYDPGLPGCEAGAGGGGAGSTGNGSNATFYLNLNETNELGGTGGEGALITSGKRDGEAPIVLYGGGGGGAAKTSGGGSAGSATGGAGAQGLIRITTYTLTGVNPPGVPIQMA